MRIPFFFILMALPGMFTVASGQTDSLLTLPEAIQKTLKNNHNIQIARYNADIAENNFSIGNAGMLPEITGQGSGNIQRQNVQQQFISGEEINRNNARSSDVGAGIYLQWTLFDGGKMFTTREKLREMREMGILKARQEIEASLTDVIVTYYDIVRTKKQLEASRKSVELSRERLRLAEKRHEVGKGTRMEKLQAKVDLQSDQSRVMEQEKALKNLRVELNRLMGMESRNPVKVSDTLKPADSLAYKQLKTKMEETNARLLRARKSEQVAHLEMKELQAERYPELNLESSYNFNRSASEAGFLQSQQNLALQYGFTFSIPIFKGFNLNRQIENARLIKRRSRMEYQALLLQTESNLLKAYQDYRHYKKMLRFEKEAVQVARENYEVARNSYEVGAIPAIELREVQQNLLNAQTRYTDALYNLKEAETRLLRISGILLQEKVENEVPEAP